MQEDVFSTNRYLRFPNNASLSSQWSLSQLNEVSLKESHLKVMEIQGRGR